MKKIIYLLIALIAQSNFLNAQDDKLVKADSKQVQNDTVKPKKDCKKSKKSKSEANKVNLLEIDFNTKKLSINSLDSIKEGEYYQIKINHINQNLFKVSLSSIDTFSSKPQQTPTFGNFDLEALTKLISAISPLSTAITGASINPTFKNAFLEELTIDAPKGPNDEITKMMNSEKSNLLKAKDSFEKVTKRIENLKFEIFKIRLNSLRQNNITVSYNFDQAFNDLEKIRNEIVVLKDSLLNGKNSYEKFSTNKQPAIVKDVSYVSNDKLIKETYEKFLGLIAEASISVSADKANELLSSIVLIENNSNNTYTSLPIQFLGEQAKVQISIN
jgi:hypothetical protein